MKLYGKEVEHITIRDINDDDIVYIGNEEIINHNRDLTICIITKSNELIKIIN